MGLPRVIHRSTSSMSHPCCICAGPWVAHGFPTGSDYWPKVNPWAHPCAFHGFGMLVHGSPMGRPWVVVGLAWVCLASWCYYSTWVWCYSVSSAGPWIGCKWPVGRPYVAHGCPVGFQCRSMSHPRVRVMPYGSPMGLKNNRCPKDLP